MKPDGMHLYRICMVLLVLYYARTANGVDFLDWIIFGLVGRTKFRRLNMVHPDQNFRYTLTGLHKEWRDFDEP